MKNKAMEELNRFHSKFEKSAAKVDKANSGYSAGLMKALKNI